MNEAEFARPVFHRSDPDQRARSLRTTARDGCRHTRLVQGGAIVAQRGRGTLFRADAAGGWQLEIRRSVLVPYSAEDMFDLIEQAEAYPQFLPWCTGATILERSDDWVAARIDFTYLQFRFGFQTRNPKRRPDVAAGAARRGAVQALPRRLGADATGQPGLQDQLRAVVRDLRRAVRQAGCAGGRQGFPLDGRRLRQARRTDLDGVCPSASRRCRAGADSQLEPSRQQVTVPALPQRIPSMPQPNPRADPSRISPPAR